MSDAESQSAYSTDDDPRGQSPAQRRPSRASSRAASRSSPGPVYREETEAKNYHPTDAHLSQSSPESSNRPKYVRRPLPQSKDKRLKGYYSRAYQQLLNETILDATGQQTVNAHVQEYSSLIGASPWSAYEKEVLFTRLATLGKDNIHGIAHAIGSKSEAQVRELVLLLQGGLVEKSLSGDRQIFDAEDVPAAYEVSEECETVLDLAAEALDAKVRAWETEAEQQRYGDYWLLTEDVAAEFEEILKTQHVPTTNESSSGAEESVSAEPAEDGISVNSAHSGSLPVQAADLLHLQNWLRISGTVMPPAAGLPEGWRSLLYDEQQGPSMYRTAFEDFHNLAISVTRRLMQAAIFQAMSRLRVTDRNDPIPAVRSRDVEAARQVLGLTDDWTIHWAKFARRNKLDVFTKIQKYTQGRVYKHSLGVKLSHDEVEAELGLPSASTDPHVLDTVEHAPDPADLYSGSDFWTSASSSPAPANNTASDSSPANSAYHPSDPEPDSDRGPDGGSDGGTSPRRRKHRRTHDTAAADVAEDAFLAALDARASKGEEARLWALLKCDPPATIKDEEADLPPAPVRKRKRKAELADWRDRVEVMAEWEAFAEPVPGGKFREMEERGRRGRERRREAYGLMVGREDDRRLRTRGEKLGVFGKGEDDEVGDDGEERPHGDEDHEALMDNGHEAAGAGDYASSNDAAGYQEDDAATPADDRDVDMQGSDS